MSDDRNNDFDDFQGFDGSNDFGDPNADGMHFSEEELEAAMAGFEQEFKDAEASKNERTDNPPSKALDSSEASDDAESSESSGIDDMLNAAEDSLKFEDELQGLLGNRAKVAVIITRLTSPRLLAAFCELSDISAQCIGSAQGAVAVLRNLDGDGPEAAVKDMTIVGCRHARDSCRQPCGQARSDDVRGRQGGQNLRSAGAVHLHCAVC